MQVVQDIAEWLMTQPAWLSDCARRLVSQGALSSEDLSDMLALVKAQHGLEDMVGREPLPLSALAFPVGTVPGADVRLQAVRQPQHLNALDSGQNLTFELQGITVVYGYNGTGKSGYARALKKACRARSVEAVYPNVYSQSTTVGTPSATIEWVQAGQSMSGEWIDNSNAPPALSQISVFDANCAKVFLDSQAQVLFVPDGLEVMHGLAEALTTIQRQLAAEMGAVHVDRSPLEGLAGQHVVGLECARLSYLSNMKDFEALASLSNEEREIQATLRKLLSVEGPIRQAEAIKRLVRRMEVLSQEITGCSRPLQDELLDTLNATFGALVAAEEAASLITRKLGAGASVINGTGTEPWQVMMRSAMAFVSEQAYPDHRFPGPQSGAHCVLCQQPLTDVAAARLRSFVQYLESDAQQQVAQHRATVIRMLRDITAVKFESVPQDRELLDELEELEPELVATIEAFLAALSARSSKVLQMSHERRISALEPLPASPFATINAWIERKMNEARTLEQAMTPQERTARLQQLADLDSRERLGPLLPIVKNAIAQLKRRHAYEEAIRSCSTTALTRKNTELYDRYVTEGLKTAFARELESLGIQHQQVLLEMLGQKGGRLQQLKLDTAAPFAKARVSHILSEGEQRVVALAMFLAEVGVGHGTSGLIFDDPVSSLDLRRRDRIAKRLVLEARTRQVIVFTHDLAFALALKDHAEDLGVHAAHRHLAATSTKKGLASDDLPFEAKKIKGRIADLRALAKRVDGFLANGGDYAAYNDLMRNGYRRLRDTWEQLVEDVLLQSTVRRYRVSVETTRLKSVSVEDGDASAVFNGMTRCSMFTHEGGHEAPPPLPEPVEFAADVEALAEYVKELEDRAKATETRRKMSGLAA